MSELPFWERPETVERFARREPDHRLRELAKEYPEPSSTRVLDLGCAGGRNTVFLAERGFDFIAVDSSPPMIAETCRRAAVVVGMEAAKDRVRLGKMCDLRTIGDGSVDLVAAFGIYLQASSRPEWEAALSETARVLKTGGRVLVATFTEKSDPDGSGSTPVPGEPHVYQRRSGRVFLVDAETLDQEMARHGLEPVVPTYTVRKETENGGRRVTANGDYQKV